MLRLLELATIAFSASILPYGEVYAGLFFAVGCITNLIKHCHLNISRRRFNLAVIREVVEMGDEYKDTRRWDSIILGYRFKHLKWVFVELLWFFVLVLLLIKAGQLKSLLIVLLGSGLIKLHDFTSICELRMTQRKIREHVKSTKGAGDGVC